MDNTDTLNLATGNTGSILTSTVTTVGPFDKIKSLFSNKRNIVIGLTVIAVFVYFAYKQKYLDRILKNKLFSKMKGVGDECDDNHVSNNKQTVLDIDNDYYILDETKTPTKINLKEMVALHKHVLEQHQHQNQHNMQQQNQQLYSVAQQQMQQQMHQPQMHQPQMHQPQMQQQMHQPQMQQQMHQPQMHTPEMHQHNHQEMQQHNHQEMQQNYQETQQHNHQETQQHNHQEMQHTKKQRHRKLKHPKHVDTEESSSEDKLTSNDLEELKHQLADLQRQNNSI